MKGLAVFWFRRDLRMEDNSGLELAVKSGLSVLPLFIFDTQILSSLNPDDARINFIYQLLNTIDSVLRKQGSGLLIKMGSPVEVWNELIKQYPIKSVFFNRDYEPYGINRDREISEILKKNNIKYFTAKDHVIFEPGEILKNDLSPYTVFTPFKNKWVSKYKILPQKRKKAPDYSVFAKHQDQFPSLQALGFHKSKIQIPDYHPENIAAYHINKDFPFPGNTTHAGPHLRFGTFSPRAILENSPPESFVNELIWREFFIHILYHFPEVLKQSFRKRYNLLEWRNNEMEFELWKEGKTGFPLVDAGMRQLKKTGYMHNRVRMITAIFLVKHLLIDWRWGEAWFAENLIDFELASNNGNWQWAAGTGCDAAPYFRVFNPVRQQEKYDPFFKYIRKWVPEYGTTDYSNPIVNHSFARIRAMEAFRKCYEAPI